MQRWHARGTPIGKAISAYMNKINDEGGINGRKLNFISLDDGYNPAKTVEQARKLPPGTIAALIENLPERLAAVKGDGPALALQAGMSERSFIRHYRADTGQTPARAIERIRVETARRLLSDTGVPIKRIAVQCGFGCEETLRRSFMRVLSVTPQAYRERFSPVA